MRVLAIGAHPDDIEIACSGTLAKCVKRGDTVIVCHVSSGNLGHVVIPPDELRIIRANEAKKAGAMAGIEVICAGFDDLEIYDNNKEARDKLVDIIKELDEAMKKQFKEKFKEINEMFQIVFSELFGGGTGTLELIEEDNLLETGIRITAQPPGKKLQNMMQLSGGEKSLTAIALLFAIQNLKPSPFCLLDEIEAALDDSNVDRFASYLKKLTKDTQFIVITHRRGTMTAADMLYGITMKEKGVSTLISVDLIEKDITK